MVNDLVATCAIDIVLVAMPADAIAEPAPANAIVLVTMLANATVALASVVFIKLTYLQKT